MFLLFCRETAPVFDNGGIRIVSLAPNITEILFAIGAGDSVAGVTRYCDFPEEAKKKRKVGGILDPDIEAILSLSPDYVIFGNHALAGKFSPVLVKGGVKTFSFEINSIEDLSDSIRKFGDIAGKSAETERLVENIKKKFADLKKRADDEPLKELRTAVIVGYAPIVLAGKGSFPSGMISFIGLKNVVEEGLSGELAIQAEYPVWSVEDLIRSDPDLIIFAVEGDGGDFIARHFNGKKVIYQPSSGIIRPGPRTADSMLEIFQNLKSP